MRTKTRASMMGMAVHILPHGLLCDACGPEVTRANMTEGSPCSPHGLRCDVPTCFLTQVWRCAFFSDRLSCGRLINHRSPR